MFDSSTCPIPAHLLRQRCYLLHFITPYKHARHYLGCSDDVSARLAEHGTSHGARLTQVVKEAGISWVVARTWRGGRRLEHKLKARHSGVRLCPICQGQVTLEEVLAEQPAPAGRVIGKRQPLGLSRPVAFHSTPPAAALDCAWCLAEQGLPMGEDSHGICTRHAEQLRADYHARRHS